MRILALDTATESCSAALLDGAGIAGRCEECERGHAERILPMIDELLAQRGCALRDLDAIAFGCGPGGFTGVRLAASIAQGLAFGAQRPVVPVSDLRAVAQRVLDAHQEVAGVLVCNDARMRQVYWGYYRRDAAGLAQLSGRESVDDPDAVRLPADVAQPVRAAGRGWRVYPQLAGRLRPRLAAIHDDLLPRAEEIARLGAADFAAGRGVPAERALPVYLRDNVARPASER